jgi:hypothetical protein
MKKLLTFVILMAFTISVIGQSLQKGEMYIPILNGTQNPVNITVAILDGSTPQQKAFLASLAAASKKATFICDNLTNQNFSTLTYSNSTIDWITTSTNWPQMQTVVLCGTVTLHEHMNYQDVDNQYTFGGWGSAELQPNLKLQGTLAGLNFTDYCPPNPMSLGGGSETSTPHPAPPIPTGNARIYGTITATLSGGNLNSWGLQNMVAAFVPASDQSSYATAIRSASSISDLATAIDNSANVDPNIQTDSEYNGSLNYKSGESAEMNYSVQIHGIQPQTRGTLYVCSDNDIYALIANDPSSPLNWYQAKGHRCLWKRTFTIGPDDDIEHDFTANATTDNW